MALKAKAEILRKSEVRMLDLQMAMTKESGAEATALQTLRAGQVILRPVERPECGRFTIAFWPAKLLSTG